MFDADTGDLLWSTSDVSIPSTGTTAKNDKAELKYSVVSEIKAVDREGDGDTDHLYFGDLGGQVFRVDLNAAHTSTEDGSKFATQITRVINLHKTDGSSPRFYESPAFSIYRNTAGTFGMLSIGSGNRSTPLLGKKVGEAFVADGEKQGTSRNALLQNDAIYNIYDLAITDKSPLNPTKVVQNVGLTNLQKLSNNERESAADAVAVATYNEASTKNGWYYEFASTGRDVGTRKAINKVQGNLILLDSDLYVSTFDAEGVGSTESCGAGIYGSSQAHRFCMPYGKCAAADTVENNTMNLGKGLLGITIGGGYNGKATSRSIIGPVDTRSPTSNKILNTQYGSGPRLVPYSWYERN